MNMSDRERAFVEGKLNEFQRDLIAWQSKTIMMWNVMNAIVLAMHKQGSLSDGALVEAGKELYENHQENMRRVKEAVAKGEKPTDLILTPMEKLIAAANKGVTNNATEDKAEEN